MRKLLLLLTVIVFLSSCDNRRRERDEYANSVEKLGQQLDSTNSIIERQREEQEKLAKELKESKEQAEAEAQAVREKEELRQKAENEPIVISNLRVSNVTQHGSVLSTDGPFDKWDVKYINWSCDYEDFVVKSGGKTYGSLYVKYMIKDDYGENSWTVFNVQGYFYTRDGRSNAYTCKYSMVDDGKEQGSWSNSLGSTSGGDFERGQWKIELFWDKDNEDKAIYLGGAYFEIY